MYRNNHDLKMTTMRIQSCTCYDCEKLLQGIEHPGEDHMAMEKTEALSRDEHKIWKMEE